MRGSPRLAFAGATVATFTPTPDCSWDGITNSWPYFTSRICRCKSVVGSNPLCSASSMARTASAGVSAAVEVSAAAMSMVVVFMCDGLRSTCEGVRWSREKACGALEFEAGGEGVVGVEQVLGGAGDPGTSGDGWCHRGNPADAALLDEPPGEAGADEGLVD